MLRAPTIDSGGRVSTIIAIEGLTKKFGNLTALNDVHLNVEASELLGLLGPNGAGKTTLISILATILPSTSGGASVCGHDVHREQHAVRKCIGIVFQDPSLDDELTGRENLDFHGRLYGMDAGARLIRVEDVLRLVDLSDRGNDLVKTYSGGMRRRLEIARGLMHHPRVLFLDEPTLGLDPQTRRKIWDYIRALRDTFRMTIVLTTHYMDEADQLCTRIAIMDRGEIVALDTPDGLKARMGGDVLELEMTGAHQEFLEGLCRMQEVEDMAVEDEKLILTVVNAESFIPKAFQAAQEQEIQIRSVSMRKPNLEDVFIKLTGREIRDESAPDAKTRMRIYMGRKRR